MRENNGRAAVREAVASDAAALARIYKPYVEATPITFEEEPPSEAEMASRIAQHGRTHGFFVAVDGADVVGYAYASSHRSRASYRWSVDVAVYVAQTQHRRGIGRSLYERLFAGLVARGFVTAYAGITLPNAASVGLHEALGFTPVGVYTAVGFKLGRWRDVGWWQKRLVAELPTSPLSPR